MLRRYSAPRRRTVYVVRTRLHWSKAEQRFQSDGGMLIEMTPRELAETERLQGPRLPRYRRIDGHGAHDWVKRGYIHETGLWNDSGRIRYAHGGE